MSKIDKAKERLSLCPKDYTYSEVHIPQELRIRSGGTERHSASN